MTLNGIMAVNFAFTKFGIFGVNYVTVVLTAIKKCSQKDLVFSNI